MMRKCDFKQSDAKNLVQCWMATKNGIAIKGVNDLPQISESPDPKLWKLLK